MEQGWPTILALIAVVLVAAPAIGFALVRLIMRRLVDAPLVIH